MSETVTTNATCSKAYDWMTNSLGQSPCVVTSHLFTSCGDGCDITFDDCTIPAALSPGTNYTNPNDSGFGFSLEYGVCTCTTVWYSTLSACAACQGRVLAIDPWIVYSAQCDPLYIQKFPNPIPNGTAVPGWAFLPKSNDMFDLSAAQALASIHPAENQAPTVIPGQLSSTTLPTSAHSPISTASDTPTSTLTSTPGVKKKNLAGIIAGSVVGGGVFFLALAALIFRYVRRRRGRFYTDKLEGQHGHPPTSDPYTASPTSSASGQPRKSATTTRTSGAVLHTSSSNHTVLTDVAGFPSSRSPPTSKPASSPTATATASPQSLSAGGVRSDPVPTAGPSSHAIIPEQESDSGWREGRPGTLPPPYTAD